MQNYAQQTEQKKYGWLWNVMAPGFIGG